MDILSSHKRAKIWTTIILVLVLAFLLVVCCLIAYSKSYNVEKNPLKNPGDHWFCQDPHIELIHDPEHATDRAVYCIIETSGGPKEYELVWVGASRYFHVYCPSECEDGELYLLTGKWHVPLFDSQSFTLEIDTETDQIWGGAYEEIVFTRVD